jgi:hypothetical protein
MLFGRLDWNLPSFNKGKTLVLSFGLFTLVGSLVVLGLTVGRISDLKTTIERPRAAGGTGWPACAYNQSQQYWCTDADCKTTITLESGQKDYTRNMEVCCAKMGAGGTWRDCSWPARGWCNASQCDGTIPDETQPPGSKKGRCGLYYYNEPNCTATTPETTFYRAKSPIGGATVTTLTPTFTWDADTTGINYNNICVGADSSCNGLNCSWNPSLSARSYVLPAAAGLTYNTTYYWVLYGDGPAGIHGTGCQNFKTGAAPQAFYSCQNGTCAVAAGATANTNGCTTTGGTCCTSTSCPTGQTCSTAVSPNVCVTTTTFYSCQNGTCAVAAGATANTNGCTTAGGQCCTSTSCPTGQTCDTTKSPNQCSTPTCNTDANCTGGTVCAFP